MKDDFGYFGSGLVGYVQYNEAFEHNFNNVTAIDNIFGNDVSDIESRKCTSVVDQIDAHIE